MMNILMMNALKVNKLLNNMGNLFCYFLKKNLIFYNYLA